MKINKFRAWHEKSKQWIYIVIEAGHIKMDDKDMLLVHDAEGLSDWQQFTTFKDIKGLPVYEGDVVKVYDVERGGCGDCPICEKDEDELCEEMYICTQTVKWNDYSGYFCEEDTGEFCPALGSDEIQMEVIGNILQNPELK